MGDSCPVGLVTPPSQEAVAMPAEETLLTYIRVVFSHRHSTIYLGAGVKIGITMLLRVWIFHTPE